METGRDDYAGSNKHRVIPGEEPVFIARGQDSEGPATARYWALRSLAKGAPKALIEQALQQADRMEAWPVKKLADADHITDPEVLAQLEAAFDARGFSEQALASDPALAIAEARGRTSGFTAGVRSLDAPIARYREQIEQLRAEAAQLQGALEHERLKVGRFTVAQQRAQEVLRRVRAALTNENGLNGESIVCTVWSDRITTAVDDIDAVLSPEIAP